VVAGKTGTSDDLRDSWFAGFSSNHLIVAWMGADDNRPIGLTGSAGAAKIWAGVLGAIEATSYAAPRPDTLDEQWIDYLTGDPTAPRCPDAVAIPVPADLPIEHRFGCGGEEGFGARIRSWLRGDGR
jgi:penicillin-binding protein 1B